MDQKAFKQFVLSNPKLVSVRPAGDGLSILKYRKSVFYDNSWNDYLEFCRGTIVDSDFNLVSIPFQKIYNYGIEARSPKLDSDEMVHAWRKVNGFMAAITWHNDDLLISTTGSVDSDYVQMIRELIDLDRFRDVCKSYASYTFMFECVHPKDPHIIPEKPGLYFLGSRAKLWDSCVQSDYKSVRNFENLFGTIPVEYFHLSMGSLLDLAKSVKHEGFVFYTDSGISSKIKSPHYLVNKWVARNPRTDKIMREDFKNSIDEEYHGLVDIIRDNIVEYTAMDEQARLSWIRKKMEWD